MKEIEQDVLRTAGAPRSRSVLLASKLAIGLKNCSRTMRAALTRKMRKAWALRLQKMGKCATPACLL